jgi:hypothetical protein
MDTPLLAFKFRPTFPPQSAQQRRNEGYSRGRAQLVLSSMRRRIGNPMPVETKVVSKAVFTSLQTLHRLCNRGLVSPGSDWFEFPDVGTGWRRELHDPLAEAASLGERCWERQIFTDQETVHFIFRDQCALIEDGEHPFVIRLKRGGVRGTIICRSSAMNYHLSTR